MQGPQGDICFALLRNMRDSEFKKLVCARAHKSAAHALAFFVATGVSGLGRVIRALLVVEAKFVELGNRAVLREMRK